MAAPVKWENGLRIPLAPTLAKYFAGSPETKVRKWRKIAKRQGYVCAICGKQPASGILHIEHEHVRGFWKKPLERREDYIRGLVCQFCNRFILARQMTLRKAKAIVRYLEAYEKRMTTDKMYKRRKR